MRGMVTGQSTAIIARFSTSDIETISGGESLHNVVFGRCRNHVVHSKAGAGQEFTMLLDSAHFAARQYEHGDVYELACGVFVGNRWLDHQQSTVLGNRALAIDEDRVCARRPNRKLLL